MTVPSIPAGTFSDDPAHGPQNANAGPGVNNLEICQRTGFKVPRSTLRKQWDGLMVRPESYEGRHPQDFVRAPAENPKGSPAPEPADTFIADADQVTVADLG